MIHNGVADHIVAVTAVMIGPVAVEGQSAGHHTNDIVSPISLEEALILGIPYMVAEVKPDQPGQVVRARHQLEVVEDWGESQGATVVRVGAPDPETGEPQLELGFEIDQRGGVLPHRGSLRALP